MRGPNFTCLHYFILISSAYPKFDLLPPANEVWGKVVFTGFVCPQGGLCLEGAGSLSGRGVWWSLSRGQGSLSRGGESLFRGSQGTLSRAGSVQGQGGSQSRGVSVQGDLCPGDLCEGGSL